MAEIIEDVLVDAETKATEKRVKHGTRKVAFRCKECGYIVHAGVAGESTHPHACSVCGGGVQYHTRTGIKTFVSGNWETLAGATPERLAELGLKPEDVEKHVPAKRSDPNRTPQHITRTADEGVGATEAAKAVKG